MGWHTLFQNAVVSSFLKLLVNNLTNLACTEIGHFWKVNENLESLITSTGFLQLKLIKLSDNELPEEWKPWVQDVTKLFYDVDDIIDGIRLDIMKRNHIQQLSNNVQDQECTSNILSTVYRSLVGKSARQSVSHHRVHQTTEDEVKGLILKSLKKWDLPHKISDLLKKLQRIEKQINSLIEVADINRPSSSTSAAQTSPFGSIQVSIPSSSSHIQGPLVTARENDKSRIIEKLCKPLVGKRGVCIVGMSGLGKTTLARSIHNDVNVRIHFESIFWASGQFVADGYPVNLHDHRGKILIVWDDLSSVHHIDWDNFRRRLPSEAMFLITTRDPKVAYKTSTTPYHIKRLSDEDCKDLIINKLPENLVSQYGHRISRIARKCEGLPLVANLLSLMIPAHCDEKESEAVISDLELGDLWELKEFQDEILPALRYNDPVMPPELGKFLPYLSLFPCDYYFKKDELAQFWMAEGFVTPETWSASGLKKAGTYFDDLLSRSLLHSSNYSKKDNAAEYQIHEFTHRFSQRIASNMCYQMNDTVVPFLPTSDTRHLSLCSQNIEPNYLEVIENFYNRLRTLLLLPKQRTNISDVPESLFLQLEFLRVVSLSQSCITSLPRSVRNLKHLRYLDASHTLIQNLPDTMCELFGLRVIKLKRCPNLLQLPNKIGNLLNLFYLDVDMTILDAFPPCIGSLTNLQILEVFIVKKIQGYRIIELKNMNCLRGSIKIMELENVGNALESENANLSEKRHLEKLELHWTARSEPDPSATSILKNLRPSDDLKELWLTNYNGYAFPSWFSSPSCNLKVIHLYNCPYIVELPAFWKLPGLKSLSIETTPSLVQLGRPFFGDLKSMRFPKLENLHLRNMEGLASWDELEPGDMPRLCDLKFVSCPALSFLPTLRFLTSLKNIEIIRCQSLVEEPEFPLSVEYYRF